MKRPCTIAFAAGLLVLPAVECSAQSLRDVMDGWRENERGLARMASSRSRFDELTAREMLATIAAEAADVQAQLRSNTAEARDFKAMFGVLAMTVKATEPDLGSYPAFRARVREIHASCVGCHDKYKD